MNETLRVSDSRPSGETAKLDPRQLLDAILAQQRREWGQGKRVPPAERLKANPALTENPAWAAEVIYNEFVLAEKTGERRSWDAILEEFPQYSRQLRALRFAESIVNTAFEPPTAEGNPFGEYKLAEQVGSGGMGIVYRAIQISLGRPVAVKVLTSGEFSDLVSRDRFLKEALAVSQLNHPNIVQIYNVGTVDGRPFIAFEFIDGQSLAGHINGTPLPARTAASFVATVGQAIQYAHDRGIVHRDLKPANVMLARAADGVTPKVTDFGAFTRISDPCAKQRTQIIGTPAYMAPEQLEGAKRLISVRTDVYGLGAVLYECLTGVAPFRGESVAEVLRQVVEEMPISPRLLNSRSSTKVWPRTSPRCCQRE